MTRDILAMDVGTTAFKLGVFSPTLEPKCEVSHQYEPNIYGHGKADVEPEKWWEALKKSCQEARPFLDSVGVVSFSVTTPGLTPMAEDGEALGPAILFFDGRSHEQAREIQQKYGKERFLRETCNLPVSGGSSLCSIMWIRENEPEVWKEAYKFGHCNTYMVKRFSGNWAIDPSTTSLTGLYSTAAHDLTWNQDVLATAEIPEGKLPPLMQSYNKAGDILPEVAEELGLPKDCDVLCGGNDAVLAALSGGFTSPGDINDINGTCEITNICVDKPVSSPNFNVRCHVIPDRWVTFFVLNAGGIALEWFHSVFCQDMSKDDFFATYIPSVLADFLGSDSRDEWNEHLPNYVPYLQGSRYSTERLTASFSGLDLEVAREDFLLGLLKGIALYHKGHIEEVSHLVELGDKVMCSGGASRIENFLEAKRYWTGDFEFLFQDESSLLGAAMLGQFFLTGEYK